MSSEGFCEEIKGIYRLRIPFEAIYTSVFLIRSGAGAILVDCGSSGADVDAYIIPALEAAGYRLCDVRMLVLTHHHGDHAGGLARITELAPAIEVIREARPLAEGIFTYPLAGHTEDCIGIFDPRSSTLITGDGLQGAGVDKYRCYTKSPEAYLETIDRIKNDKRIENLLFSHAYEPWNRNSMRGRAAVEKCLLDCAALVRAKATKTHNGQ